ncbi:MAG: U32 family peptidase, partial [Clostridiales bacterium]
ELTQALALAHFYGVKIYLTINTLLAEDELPAVVDYLAEVEKIGIDAVIIQDLGLLRILGEAFPALPIHASTQMTIFNSAGVNFLAEYGVKRAILARELSLKELAASKKHSKIELESFVHGALCISYSGQCLLSSMIGARSGNRGRCAQPCRLNYSLLDEKHNVLGADLGEYILSPKDLYGYLSLEDIFALDLSSWKIEGRMKRPEYVAIVTSVYRRALDSLEDKSLAVDQQEGLRRLLQVFNRDYCAGFWHGDPGRDYMSLQRPNNRGLFLGRIQKVMGPQMEVALENDLHKGDGLEIWVKVGGRLGLTVGRILLNGVEVESASAKDIVVLDIRGKISPGDRIFKTADALLLAEARDSWENLPDLPLRIKITAKIDQPLFLEAEDGDGFRASYEEDFIVPRALKTPTSQEMIREQLARLGGSHYYLQNLDYDLDEEIMLPKSILNNSRRSLVEFLQQERRKVFQRENSDKDLIYQLKTQLQAHKREKPARKNSRYDNYAANLLLTALSDDEDVLLAAAKNGVRQAYLTGENFAPQKKRRPIDQLLQQLAKENCRLIPSLPRIFHESQNQYWLQEIEKWQKAGVDGILAPTVNALGLLKMAGWQGDILGDSTMNIFNSQALHWCREANLSTVHLSSELTLEQIKVLAAFTKRDL